MHQITALSAAELPVLFARHLLLLSQNGIVILPEDVPRLNEMLAASPELPALMEVESAEMRFNDRRALLRRLMTQLGNEMKAAGVVRTPPEPGGGMMPGQSPDPTVWANGTHLQRVAETVHAELDEVAALADMASFAEGGPLQRELTGLGWLYTEDELAQLLHVSRETVRSWRRKRQHFEWIKIGQRNGTIRYTERGIRAFFAAHLQNVDLPALRPNSTFSGQ